MIMRSTIVSNITMTIEYYLLIKALRVSGVLLTQ